MAFFAIKLNCQYSYLDKLQNGIPFLLLSSLFPLYLLYFHIYVHYSKAWYGLKDIVVDKTRKRQMKAY